MRSRSSSESSTGVKAAAERMYSASKSASGEESRLLKLVYDSCVSTVAQMGGCPVYFATKIAVSGAERDPKSSTRLPKMAEIDLCAVVHQLERPGADGDMTEAVVLDDADDAHHVAHGARGVEG